MIFQGKFVSAHEGEFRFMKAIALKILISGIIGIRALV